MQGELGRGGGGLYDRSLYDAQAPSPLCLPAAVTGSTTQNRPTHKEAVGRKPESPPPLSHLVAVGWDADRLAP